MNEIVFKYFNNHPKEKKTTDCVVRALSKALNIDYLELRLKLNRKKNELGFTSYKDKAFIFKYLDKYERIKFKAVKNVSRIKGYDFCDMYRKGVYILSMACHLTCCIDGVIYDTWDCSYRTVYTAWKIIE